MSLSLNVCHLLWCLYWPVDQPSAWNDKMLFFSSPFVVTNSHSRPEVNTEHLVVLEQILSQLAKMSNARNIGHGRGCYPLLQVVGSTAVERDVALKGCSSKEIVITQFVCWLATICFHSALSPLCVCSVGLAQHIAQPSDMICIVVKRQVSHIHCKMFLILVHSNYGFRMPQLS